MDHPTDNLVRAYQPGLQFRDTDGDGDKMPTLFGHFTRFDDWAEIDSMFEGNFMERTAPGAFAKTIRENRSAMKVLYDHGHDPQLGNKPLGPIDELREDDIGPYYEVPLIATDYNRDFVHPALEAGLLGASYRFRVIRDEWDDEPEPSAANPKGIPERTIKEARVFEFGPVTFPAFDGATAKVRSLTDHYMSRTSPDGRAAPDGHPTEGDAAPPADTPPVEAPVGLTPAQREHALRAVLL